MASHHSWADRDKARESAMEHREHNHRRNGVRKTNDPGGGVAKCQQLGGSMPTSSTPHDATAPAARLTAATAQLAALGSELRAGDGPLPEQPFVFSGRPSVAIVMEEAMQPPWPLGSDGAAQAGGQHKPWESQASTAPPLAASESGVRQDESLEAYAKVEVAPLERDVLAEEEASAALAGRGGVTALQHTARSVGP